MAKHWYLRCNACNFRLPDNTAASNKCPQCGAVMHIHDFVSLSPITLDWRESIYKQLQSLEKKPMGRSMIAFVSPETEVFKQLEFTRLEWSGTKEHKLKLIESRSKQAGAK